MKHFVSVVIAAYNVEKYIDDCLQSILLNKCDEISVEIIVVDDGSTDKTNSIVHKYTDSGVTLIKKSNGGQSSARNLGIKYVRGDYLIFIDADDMIAPNTFKKCIDSFLSNGVDMVMFDAEEFYSDFPEINNKFNTYQRPSEAYNLVLSNIDYFDICIHRSNYNVSPCMYVFRAEMLSDVRFFEGIIYEDNLFTTQLILSSKIKSVYCLRDKLYLRRLRSGSTVTELKTIFHFNSYMTVYHELCKNTSCEVKSSSYNMFCGNILALSAKIIGDIPSVNLIKKIKLKLNVFSKLILNPKVFRFRVVAALFFGKFYSYLVFYIKSNLARK